MNPRPSTKGKSYAKAPTAKPPANSKTSLTKTQPTKTNTPNSKSKTTNNSQAATRYLQYYNTNCKSLDARTFSDIKKTVLNHLKQPDCPPEVKIMFGEWLFKKIYMSFKLEGEAKTEVCADLYKPIDACARPIVKAEYLKFLDYEAVGKIAEHFYNERFKDKDKYFVIQMLNDTELIKGMTQNPNVSDAELLEHFLNWITTAKVFEQRSNLLDVLLKFYSSDKRVQQVRQEMRFGGSKSKDIYSDAQNVHDDEIKESTLKCAWELLQWDEENGKLEAPEGVTAKNFAARILETVHRTGKDKKVVQGVIERMCIDTTTFEYVGEVAKPAGGVEFKKKVFTIWDIFLAMIHFIKESPSKDTLKGILMEELREMVELCASGYVTRFINVLRGFDGGRFSIEISFDSQLYAVVNHHLQVSIDKAPEHVVLGSFDESYRGVYLEYVKNTVNSRLLGYYGDYSRSDVDKALPGVMKKITGFEDVNWMISQGSVEYASSDKSSDKDAKS